MNKKDFIQRCVANSILHTNASGDDIITRAERYWDRLDKRGYGNSKSYEPRATGKNWYKELSAYQKEWFDKFWIAYNLKRGKDGAAMRWFQLGEPSQVEYEKIVNAAKLEAENRPALMAQNVTPMMAQGWLSNRRYADHIEPEGSKINPEVQKRMAEMMDIQSDITHFSKMDDDFSKKEVIRLKEKLSLLKNPK